MSDPPVCETNHANTKRIREAQVVYGTPGVIFARYRCLDCGIEWDDPSEGQHGYVGQTSFIVTAEQDV